MRWFHPPWPSCICFSTSVSRSQRTLSPTLKGQGMMGLAGSTASPAALGHTIITHLLHWDTPSSHLQHLDTSSSHTCSTGTHHHHTPAALGHTIIIHLQHWDTLFITHLQQCDRTHRSSHTSSTGTHHHHTPAALGHNTLFITHLQHWDTRQFITHLQPKTKTVLNTIQVGR